MPRTVDNGRPILHDTQRIDLGLAVGCVFDVSGLDEIMIQADMAGDAAWVTSTIEVQFSLDGNVYYGFDDTQPTAGTAVTLTGKGVTEPLNVTAIPWIKVVPTSVAASLGNYAEITCHGERLARGV